MEKVHDRGERTNNKAEKNVKYWLEDHKRGDRINSRGLEEEEESGRMLPPEPRTGPATLNCRCGSSREGVQC